MFGKTNNRIYKFFPLLLFIINLVFYLPVIFSFPGFIVDDYIIFSYLQNDLFKPFAATTNSQFFISLRPFSYFNLWVDFNLFGNNYIAIKLLSLAYHLVLVLSFYFLMKKVINLFSLQVGNIIPFLVTIIFSIHLDSLVWIYWISNRTELLMSLFYVLSALFFLKYFDSPKKLFLLLSLACYIISVLSKQSALHLPLILLAIFVQNKDKYEINRRNFSYYFILSILILILLSIVNALVYGTGMELISNLWKKPFTLFGIFIHTLIPIYSTYIYNYFLVNKIAAAGLLISLSVALFLILKYLKVKWRNVYLIILLMVIILYPRIFAYGSQRLNGIIIIWLCIGLLFLISMIRNKSIGMIILTSIVLLYTFSFISRSNELLRIFKFEEDNFQKLTTYLEKNKGKTLIICSDSYDLLPYKYYYYKYNKFGVAGNLISSPIFYELVLVNNHLQLFNKEFISVTKNRNRYNINSSDPHIYLLVNSYNANYSRFKIISRISSDIGRGYKELVIEPMLIENVVLDNVVYFTGKEWVEIK
ncbi:MAG: hypothetical protein AB1521_17060 [Bacteroidota bacterium]